MPNFEELGFKVGLSSYWAQMSIFKSDPRWAVLQGLQPPLPIGVGNGQFKPKKEMTDIEIKLLKVSTYMGGPVLFYLALPNSISNLAFLNVCGLPYNETYVA